MMCRTALSALVLALAALRSTWAQEPGHALPLAQRIATREFPSVFQAWNPADNLKEAAEVTAARHDLIFQGAGFFGLAWNDAHEGLATGFTPASIAVAKQRRAALLARNPHQVLLLEIRYRDAAASFLPADHAWWRRDASGKLVMGWAEGGYVQLDFGNPAYQAQVAAQAQAALATGVVDGIMLDWWRDDPERLALLTTIRRQVGEQALILVNPNDVPTPQTAPLINGYFMECYRSETPADWQRLADTLRWAEKNLRAPRINCLETWYHQSRADLNLMRATTTLALTQSDGYCLFSDPNPLPAPDHLHHWYPFWEKTLGQPTAPGERQADGTWRRAFSGGTVVYNPPGNQPVTITLPAPRTSAASGKTATTHLVPAGDGDLFLIPTPPAAATPLPPAR